MDTSFAVQGYSYSLPAQATAKTAVTGADKSSGTKEVSASSRGDTASISDAAKKLSKLLGKYQGKIDEDDQSGDPVERIKKQLKELQKKIVQVEQSDLPDGAKQATIKGLETEMAALTKQLASLTSKSSSSGTGGSSTSGGGAASARSA